MDKSAFKASQPILDEIAEIIDKALTSPQFASLREAMVQLNKAVGPSFAVGLNVTVDVFDENTNRDLPLLSTGLCSVGGSEPFRTWNDSTPQRYVLDGQIQVVPHDRCPKCWEVWDFKWDHQTCPHCAATLGENCKILLDTDTCPNCEKGAVSVAKPTCDECGFVVDLTLVVWG